MRIPLIAIAVLALAGACGGGTPATAKPATSVLGTAAVATATPGGAVTTPAPGAQVSCNDGGAGTAAEIFDLGFRPNPVTADADLTVTWTNTGAVTHTITFDAGPDCGSLASGDTLSVLFPGPGSYAYHCAIHAVMKGTVTV